MVLEETGLIPHVNAGVLTREELTRLREVSGSQGLMLETTATRLGEKGGPHYRSPDKVPKARLETIRLAGELAIPFTTGLLVGIGDCASLQVSQAGTVQAEAHCPCLRTCSCCSCHEFSWCLGGGLQYGAGGFIHVH